MRLVSVLFSFCLGVSLIALWPSIPRVVGALSLPLCLGAMLALLVLLLRCQSAVFVSPEHDRWVGWFKPGWLLALCCALLAGHGWGLNWASGVLSQRLPADLVRQDIWVRGQVSSLVEPALRGQRFTLTVDAVCERLLPENCQWLPASMQGARIELRDYSGLNVLPGERWRLRVRLRPVHGQANPGGYDLELQRFAQRITTQGYVRETGFNQTTEYDVGVKGEVLARLLRWRQGIADRLLQDTGLRHPALLLALITGADHQLGSETWDRLAITGTTHLVVVSGLHVGLIATLAYWLCRRVLQYLPRYLPGLMSSVLGWQPAQRYAAVAAIVSALLYSLLAGFSMPTQRAVIMTAVLLLGQSSRCRLRASQSLMLAATLVLMMNPLAIWQAGFWMSFVAVAALLMAMSGYFRRGAGAELKTGRQWPGYCREWLSHFNWYVIRPQLVVTVALLVPLLAGPGQVSLVSPLSNLVAIPLMGFLIVPMALIGALLTTASALLSPLPGHWCWVLADMGIGGLMQWIDGMVALAECLRNLGADLLADLFAEEPTRPVPGLLAWMLAGIASVVLLLPRGMLPRLPALLLFFPLLWPGSQQSDLKRGDVAVTVLDVGQGVSVLLQTAHTQVLYDTGPPRGEGRQSARGILPVLKALGVTRLDALIISHWHDDHAGALPGLLAQMPIGTVYYGGAFDGGKLPGHDSDGSTEIEWRPCLSGQSWQQDGVSFQMLHPAQTPAEMVSHRVATNNTSCVLRLSNGVETLLLTGDIERVAEQRLVERHSGAAQAERLTADWLLAPHHGSRSSSSPGFLQAVTPTCLLISAGAYNRFDHPHQDVIERARSEGVCWFNTASSGALQRVMLRLARSGNPVQDRAVAWRGYRQQSPRFWRAPPLP